MTEQDNELRELFQRKNLENAFPPDEQNWSRMFSVLNQERKGRRRLLVYFSLLVFGFVTAWLFTEQEENSNNALAVMKQQSRKETKVDPAAGLQTWPAGTVPARVNQNSVITGPVLIKKKMQDIVRTDAPVLKAQQTMSEEVILIPGQVKIDILRVESARIMNPAKETPQLPNSLVLPALVIAEASIQQPETKESDPRDTDIPETKGTQSRGEVTDLISTLKFKTEERNGRQDATESRSLQDQAYPDTVPVIPTMATDIRPDTTSARTLAEDINAGVVPKQDPEITLALPVVDSISSQTLPAHYIFLEMGTNYLLGWKANNKTEANGFNPLIGIQYYHDVNKKVGLSVGLGYTMINHLGNTSHTSTTTRIKFGEEVDVTVISALRMHYLLMPLKLSYGVSSNDFVCVGYTLAYLLDAESRVEQYSTRLDYFSAPVVSHARGYTAGFNPYDGQVSVAYRRRLFKEWYVNGEFFYGLRDVKNNQVYASNEFERTCGFRLGLSINLWKK